MTSYVADKASTSSAEAPVFRGDAVVLDEKRRAALAEIDNAKFSYVSHSFLGPFPLLIPNTLRWFHVKVCMVAGVGFFTDAYDIFAINIASTMLGYVYGHSTSPYRISSSLLPSSPSLQDQKLSSNQDLGVKVATPVGTFVGQLLFGWLADVVGRKRMCAYLISSLPPHLHANLGVHIQTASSSC